MGLLNSDALLELLLKAEVLTPEQRQFIILNKAKARSRLRKQAALAEKVAGKKGGDKVDPDLVEIIVSLQLSLAEKKGRVLTEEVIMRAVATQRGLPFKKLDPLDLDIDRVTKTIPRSYAVNHLLLPFALEKGVLSLATYNPDNQIVFDDLERVNQFKVKPFIATKSDIQKILGEFFGFQRSITAAETQFARPDGASGLDIGNLEQYVRLTSAQELSSSDQHIKVAVNHLMLYALEQRASDIHVEPKRESCLVRYRIDGVLHTIYKLPKVVHSALTSRIKTLARMDIAEKRRPQDGRIKIGQGGSKTGGGKEAEIRVSTVPVAFGEKTVMRLLDPDVVFQDLSQIGFSKRDNAVYEGFMNSPHGIVLVTGPTGSGKSTTLYSTLKEIAGPEKNIVTVEDPVEMVHEDFNQISVHNQIDVTFSTILRNILRQDPDIIMIGEIRDLETASHAVQAALTGHLVFSTLHTNDAISAVSRLQDLGLEPFLISSTLLGVLAQRLVRRICPHCTEPYEAKRMALKQMGFPVSGHQETMTLYRGKGCRHCRNTGYHGRTGVFEIFPMSERLRTMVSKKSTDMVLKETAIREGMTTLREDNWRKVQQGVTTVEEALRVTGEG